MATGPAPHGDRAQPGDGRGALLECPGFPETKPEPILSPRPVLALDLGGTHIRAAVVLPDGSRLARNATVTPCADGPAAIVEACIAALRTARAAAPPDVVEQLVGIGISSPGPVDPFTGTVTEPPNLGPDFHHIPLAADVEAALGLPTFLDRDTNVAALGESTFGAGRGCDDFIYLTVSTGIGGGIVSGGRLFHGPDGLAGELGHVPVMIDGPHCGCGGVGHLEAVASGTALARDARVAVADGDRGTLAARAALIGADALAALDVAAGEESGDPTCTALMVRARRAIAVACVGFVNTFNPHRIIIGGAIADGQGERLLGPVRETIAAEAFEGAARHVEILAPLLGGDVSLAGAHPLVNVHLDRAIATDGPVRRRGSSARSTDPSTHARPA
jgi:glucokinase